VNEHLHPDFTSAAIAMNLVDNDNQWYACIEEALQIEMSRNVRFLFANICIHCHPVSPSASEIWDRFNVRMSDDFIRLNGDTEEIAIQKSLQHIKSIMAKSGDTLANHNLPEPDPNVADYRIRNNQELEPELTPEAHAVIADNMITTFNAEQLVSLYCFYINMNLLIILILKGYI
jgi:hypothetical protein